MGSEEEWKRAKGWAKQVGTVGDDQRKEGFFSVYLLITRVRREKGKGSKVLGSPNK